MKKTPCRSLSDMREGIIKFENPVRIINGNEPLYSYYQEESDATINILTGAIKKGKWTIDKENAELLVPLNSPRALVP